LQRIDVGTHELRALAAGSGPPDFLCLHGLVDSLEIWEKLAPGLCERGAVTRYDQRGHGESGAAPGPCSRDDLAGDALAVLDAGGVDRAIFVGHSMGGIVSMSAALLAPERVAGLVLLGTASQCNEKTARWYERIALAGEVDGNEGLRRAIYGEKSRKRIVGEAGGIAEVTRSLKELYSDPLTPKLAALRCPVLLLVGEKDPMGSRASQIIADQIGDELATLQVIPGCGHWLQIEAVDATLAALDAWSAQHGLSKTEEHP
jgi:3-oxoadipate enol-lactonase